MFPSGLPTGEAVLTTGGNLPARRVIHTVGPIYGQHEGRDADLLANCYTNSLKLASSNSLQTVAFPSISTGAYGYPKSEAAVVASRAIEEFLLIDSFVREVRLVFFSDSDLEQFLLNHRFTR
jgi:O-acetyl-ADP-ribose deacetylase (regulator of RNase III)